MSSPCDLNVTLPQITRIGIADLRDVAEHRTNTVYGSILHHICFHSGGVINVTYAADSSLLEFTGTCASMTLYKEGALVVRPCRSPDIGA